MIDVNRAERTLKERYDTLTEVSKHIFRATDTYDSRTYAVRYFDLRDALVPTARDLSSYQDSLLSKDYFSPHSESDLRWNYYLYFVTSQANCADIPFMKARAAVEADRHYARKRVISEADLDSLLHVRQFGDDSRPLPPDPMGIWTELLGRHNLAFVIDDSLQVPAVVRKIELEEPTGLSTLPSIPQLTDAELKVASYFLTSLEVQGFRPHPSQHEFIFGDVNLIAGGNGTGKTSLLEAIEFLFCGQNKRGGRILPRTVISARIGPSHLLSTQSAIAKNRLRARHLAWYSKAELRKVTLHDSFSKFNFLDTDAAVRLSVETSSDQIGKDLAQLLLGAEAVKSVDRFRRVLREISNTKKVTSKEAAAQEFLSREAKRRADELRQAPQQSDQLFQKLKDTLARLGWITIPPVKDSIDGLDESLEIALVNLQLLRGTGKLLPRSDVELKKLLTETTRVIRKVAGLHKEQHQLVRDQAPQSELLESLAMQERHLDVLRPLVASGIQEQSVRIDALQESIGFLVGMVEDVESSVAILSAANISGGTVDEALALLTQEVRLARRKADGANQALVDFESKQTALRSITQRLVHVAHEVLSHTGDRNHCPLCRTPFEESELLRRIEKLLKDEADRDATVLRTAAEAATTELETMTVQLTALQLLREAIPTPKQIGLAEAISKASTFRQQLDSDQTELDSLEKKVAALERRGITLGRLIELRSVAELPDSEISAEALDTVLRNVRQKREDAAATFETITSRLVLLGRQVREETESCLSGSFSEDDVIPLLKERAETIEDAARAISTLTGLVTLATQPSESILERHLLRASELLTELRTAVSQERSNLAKLEQELQVEKDANDSLAGLRVKLKRLTAAENVIDQLLTEHSEKAMREEVLRNNAAEISSTFARLHAPNEFDLHVEDGQLHITRRSDKAEVDLNEMSSGQRAAYALSLFLAMNESLRKGPRVILFDDPVAHIDDINTLSFLDCLRDVALSRSRQLFFATADSELTSLFKHKFRFLGEERFKVFDLVRAE